MPANILQALFFYPFAADFFVADFLGAAFFEADFFAAAFFAGDFLAADFFVAAFFGTLAPASLASERPIAMACLRFLRAFHASLFLLSCLLFLSILP
jgi:hypothetical protein